MSRKTPLFDRHLSLGARMVDFHGWVLPVQYRGIIAEHDHCRRAACVFDTCHMGQIAITGRRAGEALQAVTTQPAGALRPGRCGYGFLLNQDGGILDDTVLVRLAPAEFLLVVNAATRGRDLQWLAQHLAGRADVTDRSDEWGKLDLQGPASFQVLRDLADGEPPRLEYFRAARVALLGRRVVLSRTGYTGELGYEIFAPVDALGTIFDRLVSHRAVAPAGLGARDVLRLEMSYPLYGQDIWEQTTPLEAGLERFVDLRRSFLGAGALAAAERRGVRRRLVAFVGRGRRRADRGQEIAAGGEVVGTVTSAGYSPSLGVSVGLGYVWSGRSAAGTPLAVRHPRGELEVTVASRPVYQQGSCRTRELSWEGGA